jgi:hydroxyacylglutathione hydrolase
MFFKRLYVKEHVHAAWPHRVPRLARAREEGLKAKFKAGAKVVDVRRCVDFAKGHFPGSLNVGSASRDFALCIGFFFSKEDQLLLVADRAEQAQHARLELYGAGFAKVEGFIEASRLAELHRLTQLNVFDLKSTLSRGGKPEILDVRSNDEWESNGIPRSKNIPLAQLASRVSELSLSKPLVVVCQNGYRSAVASSWLQACGFDSVQHLLGGMDAYGTAPLNEYVEELAIV